MPTAVRTEESLFAEALEHPTPEARQAFLEATCGDDAGLRHRVENLLKSHTGAGSFLRKALAVTEMGQTLTEGPGTVIGPYKLLQQIGEGGMGVVYMADQETPVRRRVALKIIKPGMDSREVIARFEAERQALAMMDHQNIAKVLDAGTTESGRPYFVMELVHGVPLTKYCDDNRLTPRQRLELFVPVCHAIQHAHQKGVIHRDIKPSNILVTMYDDKPVPKVIDFGVAKAVEQRLTEKTLFTQYGTLVGTFEYMSPEQAEMNAFGVDTRSDVYSLGVLLYELLTGTTPLEKQRLRETALQELLRMIKEEEPPRPSVRLSSMATLPKVAANCRTEPAQLSQLLRGELDWIVMKCLEKDRTRRYETANGLARDVQHYLADEPVDACPPSLRYRLGKALRRHRGPAIAAGLLVLALTAGTIGTTLGLVRANAERRRALAAEATAKEHARTAEQAAAAEVKERRRADEEATAAKAVRDFLQDDLLRQASLIHQVEVNSVFDDGSRFLRNPTINELLDRAAAELTADKIEAKFPKLAFVQAEVLKAVGDAYAGVAPAKAIEPIQRAIELYRQSRGPDDPATLAARHSLGLALGMNRQDAEAAKILEAVLADRMRVLGPYHPATFATRDLLGIAYLVTKNPQAVSFYEQLADDARKHLGVDDIRALKARFNFGVALTYAGRIDEGIREIEAVRTTADQLNMRTDHPYLISAYFEAGVAYKKTGNFSKAIEALEMAMKQLQQQERETGFTWAVRHELGWCYLSANRQGESIAIFEKNLELAKPPQDVTSMEALGWAVRSVDSDRTIKLYEQARQLRIERSGHDDPEALRVGQKQASLLRDFRKPDQGMALMDEILPRLEKVHGRDHLLVLKGRIEKARCQGDMRQDEAADKLFQETIAQMEKSPGPSHAETLEARYWWLIAVRISGQYERVIEMADKLASQWRAAGNKPTRVADVLFQQGSNLNRIGRPAEGEPVLREALGIYQKETPQAWNTANCRFHLGATLANQRKFAEAEQLLLDAFNDMTERVAQTPAWGKQHRSEVAARLVEFYKAQNNTDEAVKWEQQLRSLAAAAPAE